MYAAGEGRPQGRNWARRTRSCEGTLDGVVAEEECGRRLARLNAMVIARRELADRGMSDGQIRGLLHRGEWVTVRSGFYVTRDDWEASTVPGARESLQVIAAHRSLVEPHAVSHTSAALLLGFPFLRPRRPLVHVTKLKGPRTRIRSGIKHHQARCLVPLTRVVGGIPVLSQARTALDIAREDGFAAGVAVIDAVRHHGTSLEELDRLLQQMWKWPFVTTARDAVAFSCPGAESIGESLARILIDELDLGLPIEVQFELRDRTGRARCDLRVGRHVFEFDGATKYRLPERGGVASVDPDQVLMAEKYRQDWVCGFQLGMSRIVWDDLWGLRRERTKIRLRREYAGTVARYGTDISDLAPYRVHRRAS
jgi:hypothetical protein